MPFAATICKLFIVLEHEVGVMFQELEGEVLNVNRKVTMLVTRLLAPGPQPQGNLFVLAGE